MPGLLASRPEAEGLARFSIPGCPTAILTLNGLLLTTQLMFSACHRGMPNSGQIAMAGGGLKLFGWRPAREGLEPQAASFCAFCLSCAAWPADNLSLFFNFEWGAEIEGCNERNNYASYLRLFLAVFLGLSLFFLRWFYCPGVRPGGLPSGDNAIRGGELVEAQAAGGILSTFSGSRHFPRIFVDYKLPPLRRCQARRSRLSAHQGDAVSVGTLVQEALCQSGRRGGQSFCPEFNGQCHDKGITGQRSCCLAWISGGFCRNGRKTRKPQTHQQATHIIMAWRNLKSPGSGFWEGQNRHG